MSAQSYSNLPLSHRGAVMSSISNPVFEWWPAFPKLATCVFIQQESYSRKG